MDAFGDYAPICDKRIAERLPYAVAMRAQGFREIVSRVCLKFLYMACGTFVGGVLQHTCFQLTSARQTNRLRADFLSAVMRQDAAFYDVHATAGGLMRGLNDDVAAVQAAIGDKSSHFLQHFSTFAIGFVVAFTKCWDVTLVMIGTMPMMGAIGVLLSRYVAGSSATAEAAYAEAGALVQQSVSQIRTVAAYGGEDEARRRYDELLAVPQKVRGVVATAAAALFSFVAWRGEAGRGVAGADKSNALCW